MLHRKFAEKRCKANVNIWIRRFRKDAKVRSAPKLTFGIWLGDADANVYSLLVPCLISSEENGTLTAETPGHQTDPRSPFSAAQIASFSRRNQISHS
jgi:hypothetical protein